MNETIKTSVIVGIGAVLLGLGMYFLRPADFTAESKVNTILFPDLKDGNAAQGMEIVSFDEKLSTIKKFEIKKVNGRWVLPSHKNYPADAKHQLVEASSSLVGIKALSQINVTHEQHDTYGVLDPTDEKVKVGSTGVGKLVKFKDGSSHTLAQLIIGKQLKDLGKEAADSDIRYVRIAGEDPVFTVKLATDKFSPKFEDWIETDLLKLNDFDITQVELRDYSVRPEDPNNQFQEKSTAILDFEEKEAKWQLKKFAEFVQGQPVEVKLTDKEQLNDAKLNGLRRALNELKIVNVFRKPQGLINSLRENEIKIDPDTMISLQQKGFYLSCSPEGIKLFARDGEVLASLRDGVEYTLRFGDFADTLLEIPENDAGSKDKPNAAKPASKINRFLMVEAKFNPDLIAKPKLEEVPPEAAPQSSDKKETPNKEEAKPENSKPESTEPAKQPAETKEPSKEKEPAKDGKQSSADGPSPFRTAAFQPPAKEADKKSADAKAAPAKEPASKEPAPKAAQETPKSTDKVPTDKAPAETKAAGTEAAKPADDKSADPTPDQEARAEAEFERKRIIRENEAKEKEYKTKLQDGQRKAKQLNERFAEWYYVIPDDVYRKIHLGKNDIIIPVKPQPGESPNPFKVPGPLQGLQPGFPPPGLMPGGK